MDCIPALIAVSRCFWQIVSDKTLQVLRHWHERSRGRRRFVWSLEPVDTAGKLESFLLIRSQQQRGKKFVVPSGSIWRRHISFRASQRELVEGFLVSSVPFCHVSVGCCPSSDLYRFVKLSYESKLTCMCLRWIVYLHLSLSQRRVFDRLFLTKHCRCFDPNTKGAEGAADLLEALSQSTQLENLDLCFCNQIPAAAWQKVRNAKWLNLKKADFAQCLAERNCWRFSCFLRVFICLCWMLSEFRFV